MFAKIIDRLEKVEKIIIWVLVFISTLISVAGVFFRYVLHNSLSFVEEVAAMCLATMIVLGVSLAITSQEHIRVTVLETIFPKCKKYLGWFSMLLTFIICAILTVVTFQFVFGLIEADQRLTSLPWLPLGYPLMVIPAGYLICSLKALLYLFIPLPKTHSELQEIEELGLKD